MGWGKGGGGRPAPPPSLILQKCVNARKGSQRPAALEADFHLGLKSSLHLVAQRICAIYHYNCTKNGKGLKVGTKEADSHTDQI